MKIKRIIILSILSLLSSVSYAQQAGGKVEVDYNNPKKYIIGGVSVEGNKHLASERILNVAGLREGMEVTVPGDVMSSAVNKLWLQRYFEDVAVSIDSLVPTKDTAYFKISVIERPRVSR